MVGADSTDLRQNHLEVLALVQAPPRKPFDGSQSERDMVPDLFFVLCCSQACVAWACRRGNGACCSICEAVSEIILEADAAIAELTAAIAAAAATVAE